MHKEEKFDDPWVYHFDEFFDGDEIFKAFGHFALINMEMANMNEVFDPFVLIVVGL